MRGRSGTRAERGIGLGVLVSAALLLGACGEKPQTATAKKSDAAPSTGSVKAGYTAPGWKAGDATSWETQLKRRAEGQNEHSRLNRN
jgi:hypothetical protein